jgi:hypothetical protein
MASWRVIACDKAILKAISNGFDDEDIRGWDKLPADVRIACVKGILEHNGMENIVIRHTFCKALWPYMGEHPGDYNHEHPEWQKHLTNMVLDADWCRYLKDHL